MPPKLLRRIPVPFAVSFFHTPCYAAAWKADESKVADLDLEGFEGTIELQVFRRSYRVFLWKDGAPQKPGDRYIIKQPD